MFATRLRAFTLSASLAAIIGAATAAPAGLPTVRVLPTTLAVDIAQRALAACAAKGWHVSVAVADPAGVVRTLITDDGVKALTVETARRKAHTAALMAAKTSDMGKWTMDAPRFEQVLSSLDNGMIYIGGGVPIIVAGQLVGAVGVGGAPRGPDGAEHDERCALTALEAVSEQLR